MARTPLRFSLRTAPVSPKLFASVRTAVSDFAADAPNDARHTNGAQVPGHFADATPMRTLAVKVLSRAIDFGIGRSTYFSRGEGPALSDFEGSSDAPAAAIERGVPAVTAR